MTSNMNGIPTKCLTCIHREGWQCLEYPCGVQMAHDCFCEGEYDMDQLICVEDRWNATQDMEHYLRELASGEAVQILDVYESMRSKNSLTYRWDDQCGILQEMAWEAMERYVASADDCEATNGDGEAQCAFCGGNTEWIDVFGVPMTVNYEYINGEVYNYCCSGHRFAHNALRRMREYLRGGCGIFHDYRNMGSDAMERTWTCCKCGDTYKVSID